MRYEWHYGENIYQRYYDTNVENSYLCVYENKWNPGVWLGMYDGISLHNKTRNDRVRKKQGLPKGCSVFELRRDYLLSSDSPEYMMKKVEWAYNHKLIEICQ